MAQHGPSGNAPARTEACHWHHIILLLHEFSDPPMRDLYAETSATKGILWS